jgi:hypothetical protein
MFRTTVVACAIEALAVCHVAVRRVERRARLVPGT